MIIDASVGLKWIINDEAYAEKAIKIYNNALEKKEKVIVPNLFFIEVANALTTKSHTSEGTIKSGLDLIFDTELTKYNETNDDIKETSILAKQFKTTVYDMLYAVIAKKHKTSLITADEGFKKKTRFPFVKLISEM